MDHAEISERIDLWLEGELPGGEAAALAVHLAECAACRGEVAALTRTREQLAGSRIAVRPDWSARVMAALPHAAWEARSPRAWALPLALVAVLACGAAALVGTSAARLQTAEPFLAALGAIFDLLGASLLAGSGLFAASWRGVGLVLGEVLRGSPVALGAAAVAVVGLNFLLYRLLRRPRPAAGTLSSRGPRLR